MHTKIGFLTIILVSAATIAWAEPKADHSQLAAQVTSALEKCEWKVRTSSGGPKALMLLNQEKMRRVLEEIQAARSVDSNEIADVMKGHS